MKDKKALKIYHSDKNKKRILAAYAEGQNLSSANFWYMNEDHMYRGSCHGNIVDTYDETVSHIVTLYNKDFPYQKGAKLFYKYLMNESVFKDAFLAKDPEDLVEKGFLVTSNVDAQLHLGALQLTRLTTNEYSKEFEVACRLLETGSKANPLFLAWFAYAYKLRIRVDGVVTSTMSAETITRYGFGYNSNSSGHLPFHDVGNLSDLDMILGLKPCKIKKGTFLELGRWPENQNARFRPADARSDDPNNDYQTIFKKMTKGKGTTLLGASKKVFESKWKKATKKFLKNSKEFTMRAAETPMNLSRAYTYVSEKGMKV